MLVYMLLPAHGDVTGRPRRKCFSLLVTHTLKNKVNTPQNEIKREVEWKEKKDLLRGRLPRSRGRQIDGKKVREVQMLRQNMGY